MTGAGGEGRQSNDRLALAEARLAEAQRVAHVGSWEWDAERNVVSWSDEMYRIYGLEPGTFGHTYEAFLEHVSPEDRKHTQDVVFEAYRTGKPFVYDHRIVRANGEQRMLHTRGAVVLDRHGKAQRLIGSCWDITDRWKADRELEQSLSLLRATLESTADGLLVINRSGMVAAHNQRLLDLWSIDRVLLERSDFETLLNEVHDQLENGEACLKRVRELVTQPEAESFDVLLFRDGRVFERYSRPQRVGADVVGRVWSYRDVTDREGLLRRAVFLSDATRLLASLDVEAALEAVARLALTAVADACAVDLLGDAGGPRRLLSVSRDPTQSFAVGLPQAVLGGDSQMRTEGTTSSAAVPVIARGDVLGALTFARHGGRRYGDADLSLFQELARRAALSIENARLYRRATEALNARDEFLAIAAHEIRGPLTSLHLAVQGLRRPEVAKTELGRMMGIIEREDRRLARFVDELLDVGRARTGNLHFDLTAVDLAEVVRETVARLAPEVTASRSPLSVTTGGAVVGRWDRSRLEQVVTNLLENAIKFGLGRPIDVSVSSADGMARVVIRDNGIGVPSDRHKDIFQPFERLVSARHYGGLGLGLYIVRRIVEGLGGSISVDSRPDAGATFTVELPQGEPPP